MSKRISRRAWLTNVPALGGLLLTGCLAKDLFRRACAGD